MPFDAELIRHPAQPSLTGADLETIGKRASQLFLSPESTPLSTAIVKLAGEYPGITTEQLGRVVEYANQHTFNSLFEKQADDKNVEFEIAKPEEVVRLINSSAQREIVKVAEEYAAPPPQDDQALDLQADVELADMFGITEKLMEKDAKIFGEPSPAGEELSESAVPWERRRKTLEDYYAAKGQESPTSLGRALGGGAIVGGLGGLAAGGLMGRSPGWAGIGGLAGAGLGAGVGGLLRVGDKMSIEEAQRMSQASPEEVEDALQSRIRSQRAGEQLDDWLEKHEQERKQQERHDELMGKLGSGDPMEKDARIFGEFSPSGEELSEAAVPWERREQALKDYYEAKSQEDPTSLGKALGGGALAGGLGGLATGALAGGNLRSAGLGGLVGTGIGAGVGGLLRAGDKMNIERAKMMKEFGEYGDDLQSKIESQRSAEQFGDWMDKQEQERKAERRHEELMGKMGSSPMEKVAEAFSIDKVKEATSDGGYTRTRPFGDLHKTRNMLQKMAEDGRHARGKTEMLKKEASDRMVHMAKAHLLEGGQLGDLISAMGHVSTNDSVKLAMAEILPMLEHRFDMVDLQAKLAQYELEKGASQRVPNPENPFIESYLAFTKLAEGQQVIEHGLAQTEEMLKKATELVGKALKKEAELDKAAQDMPDFLDQDRPEKVKEIYSALKRDHPDMPAEKKARIAARQGKKGKQKQGPPYKGPITKEGEDFEAFVGLKK